jgi:hypothetical protein
MTDEELGDYIVTITCSQLSEIESKETDVFELTHKCLLSLKILKSESSITATRLFNVLDLIMDNLKNVAGDGGKITIASEFECNCSKKEVNNSGQEG